MKPRFWFNFQPGSPSRLYSTEKIWPHFFGLQDPSSLSDYYSSSLKKRRNKRKNNANWYIKYDALLLTTDHTLLSYSPVADIISHKFTQLSPIFLRAPGPSSNDHVGIYRGLVLQVNRLGNLKIIVLRNEFVREYLF